MNLKNNGFLFTNQSSKDVSIIARKLSKKLKAGDVILLKGSIGVGKSFFARSLINEYFKLAKIYEDIPSPSFSLVQTYDNIIPKVCHVDLYRMTFISELEEIGLEDIYSNFVTLIEWPERLGIKKPKRFIEIEFLHSENKEEKRNLKFFIEGFNWDFILKVLKSIKINNGELF